MRRNHLTAALARSLPAILLLTLSCLSPGLYETQGPDGTPKTAYSTQKHTANLMVQGLEVLALRYEVDTGDHGLEPLTNYFEQIVNERRTSGPWESISLLFNDRHSVADYLEKRAIDGGQSPRQFVEGFVGTAETLVQRPGSLTAGDC